MNSLPLDTWIRLIDWMAIGLVIYFGYSYTHSHLAIEDIESTTSCRRTISRRSRRWLGCFWSSP